MGMDISSETTLVIRYETVLESLEEKDRFDLIRACRTVANDCAAYGRNYSDEVLEKSLDCGHLRKLDNRTTLEEVRAILRSACIVEVDESRYGHDTTVLMSEVLEETLWPAIFELIEPEFPRLLEIRAFGSSRVAGYEVPINDACFIFESSQCFEKRLTTVGKSVEARFGSCEEKTWTRYSI